VLKSAQMYILRLWQEARETPNWRASPTDLSNHEKHHFATPEAFVKFVGELVGSEELVGLEENQETSEKS
jgi:hypothetical protein